MINRTAHDLEALLMNGRDGRGGGGWGHHLERPCNELAGYVPLRRDGNGGLMVSGESQEGFGEEVTFSDPHSPK